MRSTCLQVRIDRIESELAKRHDAALAAFSERQNKTLLAIDVAHTQTHELAHAQTCRVQHVKHGAIAQAAECRAVGSVENRADFVDGKHARKLACRARTLDE